MRRLALFCLIFFLAPLGFAQAVRDLPRPTAYVSDDAHVLSDEAEAHINQVCAALDRQAHAQLAVVTVKNTDGEPIADYAVELEDSWKVGAKGTDRGAILLVSVNDRKWFISTGYGLEGVLTDERAGMIGRGMQQYLRVSKADEGLSYGTDQIAQLVAQDAGVQLQVRPARLAPVEQTAHLGPGQFAVLAGVLLLLFILAARTGMLPFLLGMFLGSSGGGGYQRSRDNDDDDNSFSGFGGGSTGGGGAGGDF